MDILRLVAPKRVWVKADEVFVEAVNGQTFVMTAEVALRASRLIGMAGGTAIMNRDGMADDIREGPIEAP